jgi:hypothetical protein
MGALHSLATTGYSVRATASPQGAMTPPARRMSTTPSSCGANRTARTGEVALPDMASSSAPSSSRPAIAGFCRGRGGSLHSGCCRPVRSRSLVGASVAGLTCSSLRAHPGRVTRSELPWRPRNSPDCALRTTSFGHHQEVQIRHVRCARAIDSQHRTWRSDVRRDNPEPSICVHLNQGQSMAPVM